MVPISSILKETDMCIQLTGVLNCTVKGIDTL